MMEQSEPQYLSLASFFRRVRFNVAFMCYTRMSSILTSLCETSLKKLASVGKTKREKYHCTIYLLFDWFGISCMTTYNFCFYLQYRLI
jgi:hypothetical protein